MVKKTRGVGRVDDCDGLENRRADDLSSVGSNPTLPSTYLKEIKKLLAQVEKYKEKIDKLHDSHAGSIARELLKEIEHGKTTEDELWETIAEEIQDSSDDGDLVQTYVSWLYDKELLVSNDNCNEIFLTEKGFFCKNNLCDHCQERFKCWTERE